MLYFHAHGKVQTYTVAGSRVTAAKETQARAVTDTGLVQAIGSLGSGGEDASYADYAASLTGEWHPPITVVVARTPSGAVIRWVGKAQSLPEPVADLVAKTEGLETTLLAEHATPSCFIRATMPPPSAVERFRKDGLVVDLQEGPAMKTRFLAKAADNPYMLVSIPLQVNPFLPFQPKFKPGNVIEVKHGPTVFQVESFGTTPLSDHDEQ